MAAAEVLYLLKDGCVGCLESQSPPQAASVLGTHGLQILHMLLKLVPYVSDLDEIVCHPLRCLVSNRLFINKVLIVMLLTLVTYFNMHI